MKYFIRTVKYFFYFSFITAIMVVVVALLGDMDGIKIETVFEDGWDAVWRIAICFALISAVYPKFAFISRRLDVQEEWDKVQAETIAYFQERGLVLEREDADSLSFRRKSIAGRINRMNEDRITLTRTDEGYVLDGLRKDIILFSTALEYRISPNKE